MDFSIENFCATFPDTVKTVLVDEGFDTLSSLLSASELDINSLDIKRGHKALLRETLKQLQFKHGKGPLNNSPPGSCSPGGVGAISNMLGTLNLKSEDGDVSGRTYLKIVDFISPSLCSEEEVTLAQGVTLKMNSKVKLEKVSPAMWITANSRILKSLLNSNGQFNVKDYLQYTEMIGELASRYTWQSVLFFDDEYRQRQALTGFPWGTDAPHLGTVMLRDRDKAFISTAATKRLGSGPNRRTQAGKELCRQFNRGACTYGTTCLFDHSCGICGNRDHGAKDHQQSYSSLPSSSSTGRGPITT